MHIELIKKTFLISFLSIALAAAAVREKDKPCAGLEYANSSSKLTEIIFVAFDTETTGFSSKSDRILEIGAVKYRQGEIVDQREWLINPGRDIPYYATQVHGIDDEMVQGKPSFAEVYPEFREFCEGAVLLAHNSRFDRDFMRTEMERAGIESDGLLLIDSLKVFREIMPDVSSHSIGDLVEHFEIEAGNFHRALVDSVYILKIMEKAFVDRWDEIDLATLIEYNNGADYL